MVNKIFFVIPDDGAGGAQQAMLKLSKSATKKIGKDKVFLICLTNENLRLKNENDINIISLESRKAFLSIIKLRKLIRIEQPELIITSMANCNIITIIASFLLKTKVICREDNVIFKRNAKQETKLLKYIFIILRFFTYPFAFKIIAVSESIKKDLKIINYFLASKIKVIPNPCGELLIDNFHLKYKFHEEKVIKFVGVGRLDYQKDFSFLIKTLDICFKKNLLQKNQVSLDIFGIGIEHEKLNELIKELNLENSVKLRGYKSDISQKLQNWDGLISTPRWEGFGMNLVEAMFCNIAILLTECPGGAVELVKTYSKGFISKKDYYELAKSIKNFYDFIKSYQKIDQSKDIAYLKNFDNDFVFSKYLDLLKK